MASGHVNRTNRPNTWLHRPSLRREKSPCQLGAVHTWLHRPSLRREKSPCQLGAVHTWHIATLHWEPPNWSLSQAERTCRGHGAHRSDSSMRRTNCVTGQDDTQYGVLRDATAARALTARYILADLGLTSAAPSRRGRPRWRRLPACRRPSSARRR